MKITLPTAEEVRSNKAAKKAAKTDSVRTIVEKFLNGKVKDAIAASGEASRGVNVEVPIEAYQHDAEFYRLCSEECAKLGFTGEKSHDGGGMYSTLYVSWEAKKSKKRI